MHKQFTTVRAWWICSVLTKKNRNDESAMERDVRVRVRVRVGDGTTRSEFERIQARDGMFQSHETDRPVQIHASSNPQCCDTMLLPDLNKSYKL